MGFYLELFLRDRLYAGCQRAALELVAGAVGVKNGQIVQLSVQKVVIFRSQIEQRVRELVRLSA